MFKPIFQPSWQRVLENSAARWYETFATLVKWSSYLFGNIFPIIIFEIIVFTSKKSKHSRKELFNTCDYTFWQKILLFTSLLTQVLEFFIGLRSYKKCSHSAIVLIKELVSDFILILIKQNILPGPTHNLGEGVECWLPFCGVNAAI